MSAEPSPNSGRVPPPPGVSGKRVAVAVVIALLAVGIGISLPLATYNRFDNARRQTTAAWQRLAERLADRYQSVEQQIAVETTLQSSGDKIPDSIADPATGAGDNLLSATSSPRIALSVQARMKFLSGLDRFRTTTLPLEQTAAAAELENWLSQHGPPTGPVSVPPPTPELEQSLQRYNHLLGQESPLLDSWGGVVLDIFLDLSRPLPLELAEGE